MSLLARENEGVKRVRGWTVKKRKQGKKHCYERTKDKIREECV
jgi:hypothetical protein